MEKGAVTAVRQATVADLDILVPLFDRYRQFYGQASEPERVRQFLRDRLEHNESVIFVAVREDAAIGFTQLYPSFTSLGLARIYVLNDLYVDPATRRTGAGAALLEAAADFARGVGAIRLVLSTALTNFSAQALYEKSGWKRDAEFCTYQLGL
jgi:GNAT superfamily N-acetyltransferase